MCISDRPIGDDAALKRLEEEEQSRFAHQNVWERLRKKCPKIQAFDYDNPCEILTIKPQDLSLIHICAGQPGEPNHLHVQQIF